MGDNNVEGRGHGHGHGHGLSLLTIKSSSVRLGFLIVCLFVVAILSTRLLGSTLTSINALSLHKSILSTINTNINPQNPPKISTTNPWKIEIPLNCSAGDQTKTCPITYYPQNFPRQEISQSPPATCPEYFRWIHEDLRPWRETGITSDMVERAGRTATFRLVVINGRAYVNWYHKSFQSRDTFTLWGILQLLRRYPGQVPDLDLMFDCVDWPVIKSSDYPRAVAPPPLFRYCGDDSTMDIVFPDWSFWGWPEINIKPWESLLKELKEGNKRSRWMEREPYAYWKGNPVVAATRMDLMKCNVSDKQDWRARVYAQDWIREQKQGYKQSDLASQCIHRYKIYIEGSAWSVSEKYILACDSVTLLVKPKYYDFFTRSLIAEHHYWPIRDDDKCRSIKFAVDWGNSHNDKAQAIGKEASNFIQEEVKMDYVYDYMFHLLNEYSKLFKYKPTIPPKAYELCSETMACPAQGFLRDCMMESMAKGPAETSPCALPRPYDPPTLLSIVTRRINSTEQVEKWEKEYWDNENKQI